MKKKIFGNVLDLAKEMYYVANDFLQHEKNVFNFVFYMKKIRYKADEKEQNLYSYETFLREIKKNGFIEADCKTYAVLTYCNLLAKFSVKANFIFFGKEYDDIKHVAVIKDFFVFDDTNRIYLPLNVYVQKTKYYFSIIV